MFFFFKNQINNSLQYCIFYNRCFQKEKKIWFLNCIVFIYLISFSIALFSFKSITGFDAQQIKHLKTTNEAGLIEH